VSVPHGAPVTSSTIVVAVHVGKCSARTAHALVRDHATYDPSAGPEHHTYAFLCLGTSAPETQERSTLQRPQRQRGRTTWAPTSTGALCAAEETIPAQKDTNELHLHNCGHECRAGTNEESDQMPIELWRTRAVTPFVAWHPALRLTAARTTPDDPSTRKGEVRKSAWALTAPFLATPQHLNRQYRHKDNTGL
jgi:hypothetical protein